LERRVCAAAFLSPPPRIERAGSLENEERDAALLPMVRIAVDVSPLALLEESNDAQDVDVRADYRSGDGHRPCG
jgi:hypothetical protein